MFMMLARIVTHLRILFTGSRWENRRCKLCYIGNPGLIYHPQKREPQHLVLTSGNSNVPNLSFFVRLSVPDFFVLLINRHYEKFHLAK